MSAETIDPSPVEGPPTPLDAIPKAPAADAWPTLRRLVEAARPYQGIFLFGVLAGGLFAATRYVRAYLARPLIDDILVPSASMDAGQAMALFEPRLLELGLIAAATVVLSPILLFISRYMPCRAVQLVRRDLDQSVARKLLRVSLARHRAGASGDVLARALSDVQLGCQALLTLYREALTNFVMALGGVVAMVMASPTLSMLTVVTLPPLLYLLNYFGRRIHKQTQRRQASQGDLSQRLIAILSGIKVIKAFRGHEVEEAAFNLETERYFKRALKVHYNRVMSKASTEALTQTVGFAILAAGAWLALNQLGGVTLGTLTQFAIILMTTYKPIKVVASAYTNIMESLAGAHRLFEVLDQPEEESDRDGAREMRGVEHSIRFRDVHFAYAEEPVLAGIDLDVARGEVVAIVGRTGSGKSTLLDLLLRLHDPTRGAIEIDGVDLRDLQRDSFLDHVAVVTQEPFLFDVSVLENIRYGREDATLEDVRAAAVAAQADDFIEQLPQGYDTPVGEFGLRLSGGQRQRITIARAILRRPDILVLDEATSALDAKTERAIHATIDSLRGRHTIFLVSHRLSTIREADRIVVLDEGRIAESGDHASLMARPGPYRELIEMQGDSQTDND